MTTLQYIQPQAHFNTNNGGTYYFDILVSFIAYFVLFAAYNFIMVFLVYNTCKNLIKKSKSKSKSKPIVSIHEMLDILEYNYVNINMYLDIFIGRTLTDVLNKNNPNLPYDDTVEIFNFDFGITDNDEEYDNMLDEIDELCRIDNKHIYNLSFNEIKTNIKKTDLYMKYEKLVFDRMNRAIILSKHLNNTDINNFYDNLTLEEMKKINKYLILKLSI